VIDPGPEWLPGFVVPISAVICYGYFSVNLNKSPLTKLSDLAFMVFERKSPVSVQTGWSRAHQGDLIACTSSVELPQSIAVETETPIIRGHRWYGNWWR